MSVRSPPTLAFLILEQILIKSSVSTTTERLWSKSSSLSWWVTNVITHCFNRCSTSRRRKPISAVPYCKVCQDGLNTLGLLQTAVSCGRRNMISYVYGWFYLVDLCGFYILKEIPKKSCAVKYFTVLIDVLATSHLHTRLHRGAEGGEPSSYRLKLCYDGFSSRTVNPE